MIDQYIHDYCDILNEKYAAANKIMNRTIPYEFVPVKGRKYTPRLSIAVSMKPN